MSLFKTKYGIIFNTEKIQTLTPIKANDFIYLKYLSNTLFTVSYNKELPSGFAWDLLFSKDEMKSFGFTFNNELSIIRTPVDSNIILYSLKICDNTIPLTVDEFKKLEITLNKDQLNVI